MNDPLKQIDIAAGWICFIFIVLCLTSLIIVAVAVAIIHDKSSRTVACFCTDDQSDDSNIYYEQQMTLYEIAEFYINMGQYNIYYEELKEEEGKWWKEVSLSCPPKNVFIPETMRCEELNENKPFRMKFCTGTGEYFLKYFNMGER